MRLIHHLADHKQLVAVRRLAEHLQPLGAQALKLVRRGTGLERAAANDAGAGAGRQRRALFNLLRTLQAARAGHHGHGIAADGHISGVNDGAAGPEGAAGELVWRNNPVGFLDAFHHLENGEVEFVFPSHAAQHGVDHAGGAVHIEAEVDQPVNDVFDLLFSGVLLHYD